MKKAAIFSLLLSILALTGSGADPALAYYPPLQDVTGPVVTQGANPSAMVSVHNPATGQDIAHTWTPFDGTGPFVIDQVIKNQGIVAWRITDTASNQYMVVCGVYDPGWAALNKDPQLGWQFYQTYPWTADDTNLIGVNDGVVVYETKAVADPGSKTTILVGVYTYDPSGWYEEFMHFWMLNGWRGCTHTMTNYTGISPHGYAVQDGVSAFIYEDSVYYDVYDGRQAEGGWTYGWQLGSDWGTAPNAINLQATNGTVTWTDDAGPQKRGYDFSTISWINEADTKIMAWFDFWPTPAKPGQWVYFTDMSIGATDWNWSAGDGNNLAGRSPYHKYANAGNYLAYLQVTGPAGTDASTKTVPVKAPANPGLFLLLLN